MGSTSSKKRRQERGLVEEGKTTKDNQRTSERTANQPEDDGDGHKVFLHNPDDTETGVDFGVNIEKRVNIEKKDGRFVLKDVREGGLAYKTGFRSGDSLVMANSIDIDNVDLKNLLKELLDYKEFNYFIGVERKLDDGKKTFIWKIFKITTKDGVPDVAVLETLENDTNEMPETTFTSSTPTYDFLRVTSRTYNIYIEEDRAPTKYLTINDDKQLVFQDYNQSSKFFRYIYSDPERKRGAVVAYSLYSSFNQDVESSPATTNDTKTTTVLDFPQYMTGNNIPPDARFWYSKFFQGGFSLESMIAPGMYLGCDPDNKAILSTTETMIQISRDEGLVKFRRVKSKY